jgi:hypothetical protein
MPPVSGAPAPGYGPPPPPGYGPPTGQFGAGYPPLPPPTRKSGRGLVIGLVIGSVVLVLLLCAVVVPFALKSGSTNRTTAGGTSTTTATPSASPSPTAKPVSQTEYQDTLKQWDQTLATQISGFAAARTPGAVSSTATGLNLSLHSAADALRAVTPPSPADRDNLDVAQGLESLASEVNSIASSASSNQVCAGSTALTKLAVSDEAGAFRNAVKALVADNASYAFGTFLPAPASGANRRLANGQQVKKPSGGLGQLKIQNQGTDDAVLTLAPLGSTAATAIVYLWGGGSFTIKGIRDGTYEAYLLGGQDWDDSLKTFGAGCSFEKFSDTFKFTTTRSTYTIWSLQLSVSSGGNASATPVDPANVPT